MKKLPLSQTGFFSKTVLDYIDGAEALRPFYQAHFKKDNVMDFIKARQASKSASRTVLADALLEQYSETQLSKKTKAHIESLRKDNTFTICTAHQTNLFTGPLYFFFKIVHTLSLCDSLKKEYPEFNFVPVFWIHSEDHDAEELAHCNMYGKKIEWTTPQQGKSIGDQSTESLKEVIDQVEEIAGSSPYAVSLIEALRASYMGAKNYRKAHFDFVNFLFGKHGLVLLDQHHASLKKAFLPFMVNDLTQHDLLRTSNENNEKLAAAGYKVQALPRAINLFYTQEDFSRNRIVYEDGSYQVLNTELTFSEAEILDLLEKHPNRFSTNVLSRPLFQQFILPNLAYIGGGGELAYWLELKSTMEKFEVAYPALVLRNSALWLDKNAQKKLDKLALSIDDLFGDTDGLIKQFVKDNTESELSLAEEKKQLSDLFEAIKAKAQLIDPGLEKSIIGESTRQLKSLDNLEGKMLRAEKKKFDIKINQIQKTKDKLFPKGKLQERFDNFIPFWLKYGPEFINHLKAGLDPWSSDFHILMEGEEKEE